MQVSHREKEKKEVCAAANANIRLAFQHNNQRVGYFRRLRSTMPEIPYGLPLISSFAWCYQLRSKLDGVDMQQTTHYLGEKLSGYFCFHQESVQEKISNIVIEVKNHTEPVK